MRQSCFELSLRAEELAAGRNGVSQAANAGKGRRADRKGCGANRKCRGADGCLPIEKNRKLCYNRTGSEGREEFRGAQCGTERTDLD